MKTDKRPKNKSKFSSKYHIHFIDERAESSDGTTAIEE